MSYRTLTVTLLALFTALVLTTPAFADEHEGKGKKEPAGDKGSMKMERASEGKKSGEMAKEMSPEEAAMMQEMMEMGSPGAEHAHLATMEGTWTTKMQSDWDMDGTWEQSMGKATFKMMLGGRFLKETFHGEAMGMPFEGFGLHGYDKAKGEFVSIWCDSMSTGMMISKGSWDEATQSTTMKGMMPSPGGDMPVRMVSTMEGDNAMTFQMFCTGPDGNEFNAMTIKYSRE